MTLFLLKLIENLKQGSKIQLGENGGREQLD